MSKTLILLLGNRQGAVEAINELGFDFILWDDKYISKEVQAKAQHVIVHPFPNDWQTPDSILLKLKAYQFEVILATKEKTVMLAAYLREALSVNGMKPDEAFSCHDKYTMKELAKENAIPIVDFKLTTAELRTKELGKLWDYPFVIKPRTSSGRRGLRFIQHKNQIIYPNYQAEKFIKGQECSVESFIQNGRIILSNITEYRDLTYSNFLPACYPESIAQELLVLNKKITELFRVKNGMSHVEFYLTEQGILFGEIAIRPPGGYIMDLLSLVYDMNMWHLYILSSLGRDFSCPSLKGYAACWILHPGVGKVVSIRGIDQIKQDKNVVDIRIRAKVGDQLKKRIGVGEDYGRVLLRSNNYDTLSASLEDVKNNLVIDLDI